MRKRSALYPFFPAAALYAALVVPVSVYSMTSGQVLFPGLTDLFGHAHELVFGFAPAVVAGFLINRDTPLRIGLLFAIWCLARIGFLFLPGHWLVAVLHLAFAAMMVAMAAPQFLRTARKWRNQAFAPALIAQSVALVAFHVAALPALPDWRYPALHQGIVLLAVLMLFMGARILAPAVAGHLQTLGKRLDARVQPRLESAMLLLMLAALALFMLPGGRGLSGLVLLGAALVSLVRMLRWRLWRCGGRTDLLCLGAGYGWLVVGLALIGLQRATDTVGVSIGVHALTVGALGTLTLTVMARTSFIKAGWHPGRIPGLGLAALLMSAAAFTRLMAGADQTLLLAAALLWSGALMLLMRILLVARRFVVRRRAPNMAQRP